MATDPLSYQVAAALELQAALQEGGFAFCIIGGLAVQRWGEPRLTRDADATVLTRFVDDERAVDFLLQHFAARRADARAFALRFRVLLLRASNEVELDIALGALDFETRSIARASDWAYRPGVTLRTCCAEDLIVHKAFAGRDQDWSDIEGVVVRQHQRLKLQLVRDELTPLLALKEDDTGLNRLRQVCRDHGLEFP